MRIPAVSHADPERRDEEPFVAMTRELERQFPQLHGRLELVPIPGHALLMRWPARSERSAEPPAVLAAALDFARGGDVLTVWRLDRLRRSLRARP